MSKVGITDTYRKLLGQIVIAYNKLEAEIRRAIAELISDDLGMTTRITANDTFPQLIRLLNVLFRYRVTEASQLGRLNKLNTQFKIADESRNKYLHSDWDIYEHFVGFPYAQTYKTSKMIQDKFRAEMNYPEPLELMEAITQIETTIKTLSILRTDSRKEIRAHREKTIRNRFLPITNLDKPDEKNKSNKKSKANKARKAPQT